ncbi:MAG: hypothetical protein KKE50_02175 [Nanoarchaeota archaeon]|nr:hypothetical protein [Nanoarchaeota archaeon]
MKRGKKGISSIIATILILLVVVAAITIIWAAILPTIKNSLDETEFNADLTISKSGYTYWDKNNNITCVQIMNNGDEIEGIALIFTINKESYSETISKSETPSKNQAKKICRKLPGKPNEIKVAPIIKKRR